MLGRRGGLAQKFLTLLRWAILSIRMREARWLLGAGGLGWGRDVDVSCDLLTLLVLRHAGVGVGGVYVNVPCDLLSLLMLRHAGVGVGGVMLTFHVAGSRCWCYATLGLGWGGVYVNVPCDLLSLLMLRHAGVGVGGC